MIDDMKVNVIGIEYDVIGLYLIANIVAGLATFLVALIGLDRLYNDVTSSRADVALSKFVPRLVGYKISYPCRYHGTPVQ